MIWRSPLSLSACASLKNFLTFYYGFGFFFMYFSLIWAGSSSRMNADDSPCKKQLQRWSESAPLSISLERPPSLSLRPATALSLSLSISLVSWFSIFEYVGRFCKSLSYFCTILDLQSGIQSLVVVRSGESREESCCSLGSNCEGGHNLLPPSLLPSPSLHHSLTMTTLAAFEKFLSFFFFPLSYEPLFICDVMCADLTTASTKKKGPRIVCVMREEGRRWK